MSDEGNKLAVSADTFSSAYKPAWRRTMSRRAAALTAASLTAQSAFGAARRARVVVHVGRRAAGVLKGGRGRARSLASALHPRWRELQSHRCGTGWARPSKPIGSRIGECGATLQRSAFTRKASHRPSGNVSDRFSSQATGSPSSY
jgi:hypothetical protein